MAEKTTVQSATVPAVSTPFLVNAGKALLQRKCVCGESAGAADKCEECKKKDGLLQRRSFGGAEPPVVPPIVHEVLRSPGQPLDKTTRAFFEPRFGHDFSRVSVQRNAKIPERVEEVGRAFCDIDKGRMTWSVDVEKLPLCMADCAMTHELTHVESDKAECAKLVVLSKAVDEAIAKAEKSKSEADLKEAERKLQELEKAAKAYAKWLEDSCLEHEHKAYQAGLDACSTPEVRKSCSDFKETERYKKIMDDWTKYRDAPPNCKPAPKAEEKKGEGPKKTEPRKLVRPLLESAIRTSLVQRRCACGGQTGGGECPECDKKKQEAAQSGATLQRVLASPDAGRSTKTEAPPIVHEVLRSPGRPLDETTRTFFEPRFGHDFSKVRVHTDTRAAESARAVNALAYTVGNDIVFSSGRYGMSSTGQRSLLAHELAHTIQQRQSPAVGEVVISPGTDDAEREAESSAQAIDRMKTPAVTQRATATLAREEADARPDAGSHSPTQTQASPDAGTKPPDAGGAPPDAGSPTGSTPSAGGTAAAAATPVCQPKALARNVFLTQKSATTNDFGLTTLDTSLVMFPEVNTAPAKGGVIIQPTTAALPTIPSVFTGPGTFTEGEILLAGQGFCPEKKYPVRWSVTAQGSQKIGEGEQEHCNDFQQALAISLQRYADVVNTLANSGRVFASTAQAEAHVTKVVGVAPTNWQSVFECLVKKSLLRDPLQKGGRSSHTPIVHYLQPSAPDCGSFRTTVTENSFPDIGKRSSSDLIKGCGEAGPGAAKGGKK